MRIFAHRKFVLLITFIIVCMLFLVGYNQYSSARIEMKGMISIAHRGASSLAPENTMAAFQKAIDFGADIIECDVHLSKDGELIIIHDEKLNRTTNGAGNVKDYTLAELKTLDAGHKFNPSFRGERLITLNELLEVFYGEAGILIDVKSPSNYPGIEEKIAALLNEYGDLNSIIIQSFDVESMRKMSQLLPDVQIALLMKPAMARLALSTIKDFTSFATYINFNVSFVNKRTVDLIHKHDGKVLVWATKNQQYIDKAFQFGVDGIITDFSLWPVEPPVYLVQD